MSIDARVRPAANAFVALINLPFPFLQTLNRVTERMCVSIRPVCLCVCISGKRVCDFSKDLILSSAEYVIESTQPEFVVVLLLHVQTSHKWEKSISHWPNIPGDLIGMMTGLLSYSLMAIFTAASFFKDQYCVRFPHISTHRNIHFLQQ